MEGLSRIPKLEIRNRLVYESMPTGSSLRILSSVKIEYKSTNTQKLASDSLAKIEY